MRPQMSSMAVLAGLMFTGCVKVAPLPKQQSEVAINIERLQQPETDRRGALKTLALAGRESRDPAEHHAAAAAIVQLLDDPEVREDAAAALARLHDLRSHFGKGWLTDQIARLRRNPSTSAALDAALLSDEPRVRFAVLRFLEHQPSRVIRILVQPADPSNHCPFFIPAKTNPPGQGLDATTFVQQKLTEAFKAKGYHVVQQDEEADIVVEHTALDISLGGNQPRGNCCLFAWDFQTHRLHDFNELYSMPPTQEEDTLFWFDRDGRGVYSDSSALQIPQATRPGVHIDASGPTFWLADLIRAISVNGGCDVLRAPAKACATVRMDVEKTEIGKYTADRINVHGTAYEIRCRLTVLDPDGNGTPRLSKEFIGTDPFRLVDGALAAEGVVFRQFREQDMPKSLAEVLHRVAKENKK